VNQLGPVDAVSTTPASYPVQACFP
jgi:hypothetical protein